MRGSQPSLKTGHLHDRTGDDPVGSAHDRRHDDPHDCIENPGRLRTTVSRCNWRCGMVVSKTSARNRSPLMRSLASLRRGAHNSWIVARDIFATPNCLKSHEARKLKSPFSNIRAVTFKLRSCSSPTAVEHRLPSRLRAALKSP